MGVAAITAGLLVYGAYQSNEARRDSKRSAREQKKANAVAAAQGQVADIQKRRELKRQERVRRAQLLQASNNMGVEGSSGESGSLSALSTSISSANASIRGSALSNQTISAFNQKAADFASSANNKQAYANLAFQGASFSSGFIKPGG